MTLQSQKYGANKSEGLGRRPVIAGSNIRLDVGTIQHGKGRTGRVNERHLDAHSIRTMSIIVRNKT